MEIYLVGGAVRDKLLEYPYHEKDWVVVGANADELIALGFQPVGKDFPVFLHPDTKEEYALARTERKSGSGHTGFDCFTSPDVTLEEDLLRRDLTINAMAQDKNGKLIDPYHGSSDLSARILRHVSPAFVDDPLRVLRVARFAARYAHLGFAVAPETLQLMQTIARNGELATLPAERIWKELQRALSEQSPQRFFEILQQCHALKALMPALLTVSPATWSALARAAQNQQNTTVRFALLCIDLDESSTRKMCADLKAPNDFRDLALLISRLGHKLLSIHDDAAQLLDLMEAADAFRKVRRFEEFLCCGELLANQPQRNDQIRKAFVLSNQVDTKAIVATGLTGKAIAYELRTRRINAIANLLQ